MTSGIPNQNPWLYGPGPFKRVPTGPGKTATIFFSWFPSFCEWFNSSVDVHPANFT